MAPITSRGVDKVECTGANTSSKFKIIILHNSPLNYTSELAVFFIITSESLESVDYDII